MTSFLLYHNLRLVTLRTDWGQLRRRFPGRDTRGSFVTIRGFFNRRRVLPFWERRNKFIVRSKSVYMRATVYWVHLRL